MLPRVRISRRRLHNSRSSRFAPEAAGSHVVVRGVHLRRPCVRFCTESMAARISAALARERTSTGFQLKPEAVPSAG